MKSMKAITVHNTLYEMIRHSLLIEPAVLCAAEYDNLLAQMLRCLFYHNQTVLSWLIWCWRREANNVT